MLWNRVIYGIAISYYRNINLAVAVHDTSMVQCHFGRVVGVHHTTSTLISFGKKE